MQLNKLLASSLVAFQLCAGVAIAEECSDVLQGIYNVHDTAISTDTVYAFRNWACNSDSASAAGNYLQIVSGSGSWSKSRCSDHNLSYEDQQDIRDVIKTVNQETVGAWERCMQRRGLNTGVILSGDPSRFQVVFSYVPVSASVPEANIYDGENGFLIEGDVTCSSPWANSKARKIDINGRAIGCTRADPKETIDIIINSDPSPNNGNRLEVPGFNPITFAAPDLVGGLFDGALGSLKFSSSACSKIQMGTLICNYEYTIQYNKATHGWTVTGYSSGANGVITQTYNNTSGRGRISAWGKTLTFDSNGQVFAQGKYVGTVSLQ